MFTSRKNSDEQIKLFEHDIILWCGDLNYRIDVDSYEICVEKIKNNKLSDLRACD